MMLTRPLFLIMSTFGLLLQLSIWHDLLFHTSPYTGDYLLNYKSMDCYKNFLSGWVREILVKAVDEKKRVVIAKVGCCFLKIVASYIKLIIVKFNCMLG